MPQAYEKLKTQLCAKVQHPFRVVKNLFNYKKTRYKSIFKNDCQLNMLFAFSNLYIVRAEVHPQ